MESLVDNIISNSDLRGSARSVAVAIAARIDQEEFRTGTAVQEVRMSRAEIAKGAGISTATVSRALDVLRDSPEWDVIGHGNATLAFRPNLGYVLQGADFGHGDEKIDWLARLITWVGDNISPRSTEHVMIARFTLPRLCADALGGPFDVSVRDVCREWGAQDQEGIARILSALEQTKADGTWRFTAGDGEGVIRVTRLFEPYVIRDHRLFDEDAGRYVLPESNRHSHYHNGWDRYGERA